MPAPVQFRTVGTTAAVKSGETAPAPKAETHPRKNGRHAERQRAVTGAMPGQRRGKESSQGVCQRFLCRTSPVGRGAQRRAVQSGGTQWRCSNTCARGRGRALHTPQRCAKARRPETRPRLPRLWLCCAHNHRQCSTCAAVGRGVRHCCARRHTGHPPLPAPPRTQGTVRAVGLRTPGGGGGGGGGGSAKQPKRHRQAPASRGLAFKRGRGHPNLPPPPPREAGTSGAARRS